MDLRKLPIYTFLLPLYGENPSTVRELFDALSRLDYPKHKLDVLVEADDDDTRDAIETVGRQAWMRVLSIPPGVPRTKPRAMDVGLRYAKRALVTVYDAEDKPDPLQLKEAVWAFERTDESLACLQAKHGYYNPRQNLLTCLFTLEYDAWFNIFLPGVHRIGAPIPLGGTSNHFRRAALDAYRVAVMTLNARADKLYRGAKIAALTIPSGQTVKADDEDVGGYHLVRAQAPYKVATPQLAAGDAAAANCRLDHLLEVQQRPDGRFPRNSSRRARRRASQPQTRGLCRPSLVTSAGSARAALRTARSWPACRRAKCPGEW